jgi:hypothetical protein
MNQMVFHSKALIANPEKGGKSALDISEHFAGPSRLNSFKVCAERLDFF